MREREQLQPMRKCVAVSIRRRGVEAGSLGESGMWRQMTSRVRRVAISMASHPPFLVYLQAGHSLCQHEKFWPPQGYTNTEMMLIQYEQSGGHLSAGFVLGIDSASASHGSVVSKSVAKNGPKMETERKHLDHRGPRFLKCKCTFFTRALGKGVHRKLLIQGIQERGEHYFQVKVEKALCAFLT